MGEQSRHGTSWGIVVGYDDSPASIAALDWAAATAQRWGTTLTVLHSVDLAAAPVDPAYDLARLPDSVGEAGRDLLADGVARARQVMAHPSQVTGLSVLGAPAAELVHASQEADLVVTGSRGRGPLAAGLLGSVAYAVTAHAACPAVVVRAEPAVLPGPDHPVIVGVDESPGSERALDLAAEMAAISDAALHIVHVAHSAFSPDALAYVESTKAGTEHTKAVRGQRRRLSGARLTEPAQRSPTCPSRPRSSTAERDTCSARSALTPGSSSSAPAGTAGSPGCCSARSATPSSTRHRVP